MSKLDKQLKFGRSRQIHFGRQASHKKGSHRRCEAPAGNDLYIPVGPRLFMVWIPDDYVNHN